ncbi:uncharacterized protein LOC135125700 [Zophobas morio]|uniref:uncharacterized protein LOC135125700 n=1 Tax=Zophobas morio TaxID=2755281 RepID=UPI003082AEE7
MVSCKLCKVTSGSRSTIGREKITFHRCPQKPELKKLWTDFLYLHLGNSVSVNNFFLCSFHFEEKCFDRTSAQKVVLRPHSVPTISYTFFFFLIFFLTFPYRPVAQLQGNGGHTQHPEPGGNRTHDPRCSRQTRSYLTHPGPPYEERITNVVTFRGNETHHTEVCDAPTVEPQQNIEDELSNKVFEITKKLENLTTKTCANVLLKQQINNLKTLVSQQQCTIKTLKRRTSKQQRKICNLKDVVSSLRKKINYYENNSLDVNKFQENTELLSRMWAKINNKPLPNQYGPEIRKFAVTTHFYSPKAFSFIRKQFMDCLPHPKTLSVWYSSVNGAPGFTSEAFDVLKAKAEERKIVCSLVFDEVVIKRCIEYDGQQYYGYADMGSIIEVNENEEAKEALVFMLVAINGSWKIPKSIKPLVETNSSL